MKQRQKIVSDNPTATAKALAQELGCSIRTILRDRAFLAMQYPVALSREDLQSILSQVDDEIEQSKRKVRSGSTPHSRLFKLSGDVARLRQQVNAATFRLPVRQSYSWKAFVDGNGTVQRVEVTAEHEPQEPRASRTAETLWREVKLLMRTSGC